MNKTRRRKVKSFMRRACAVIGAVMILAGLASMAYAVFGTDEAPKMFFYGFEGMCILIMGMAVHDQSYPPEKEWRPRYVRR